MAAQSQNAAPVEKRKSGDVPPPAIVKIVVALLIVAVLLAAIGGIVLARNQGIANADGFYRTRAKLLSDVAITLEVMLFIGLTMGFFFARGGNIPAHQYNQTFWTLFNVVLIAFVMAVSYGQQVVAVLATSPGSIVRPYHWLATLHMLVGGITMLSALFLIIRMNFRLPFKFLRIKWWKWLMRLTLVGFYAAVGLGVTTYLVWYVVPAEAAGTPVAEEEGRTVVPLANFAFVPFDLTVPVGTTVVWINQDEAPHTITFDDGTIDSGVLNSGQSFEFTFNEPGHFQYFCAFHGSPGVQGMSGFVDVVAQGQAGQEVVLVPTEVTPPTATPEATPGVQPILVNLPPVAVGFLEFRDNQAINDEILLTASDVTAPTDGSTLELWLDGPAGRTSLGPIEVAADGTVNHIYDDPLQANLVASYNAFFVSIEPPGDTDPEPSAHLLFQGAVPPASHQAVQPILVSSPDAPNQAPLLLPFRFDVEDLNRHADSG